MNGFSGMGRALAAAAVLVCLSASPCAAQAYCDYVYTGEAERQIVLSAPVEWNGDLYPAQILRADASRGFLVHYIGYGSEWDEWVLADRLGVIGCQVEYQGHWYDAEILFGDGAGQFYVHYIGWGAEWDEWVGESRIAVDG